MKPARGLWVSGNFFNVLGVQPELGRLFNQADDQRGCTAPGVVISHGFWQSEFGGVPDVVGRKVTLSDHPLSVIGVTPPGFFGLEVGKSFDVALPICADAIFSGANQRLDSGTNWWLMVTGRLKPGWTIEQASSQISCNVGVDVSADTSFATIRNQALTIISTHSFWLLTARLDIHFFAKTMSVHSGCCWPSRGWCF